MGRAESTTTVTEISRSRVYVAPLYVTARRGSIQTGPVPLGLDRLVIGGGPGADMILDDRRVSGKHCALLVTPAGIVLEDLGSKNGTWIDSVRVREALLPVGVRVTLGGTELWIESRGEAKIDALATRSRFGDVVGESIAMRRLFALLRQAARNEEICILLLGETGTGKTSLARAVHEASGRRGAFVEVDCGAPGLLESSLFGHKKGSFTGATESRAGLLAAADGGTLFLDEIGDLPIEYQARLLKAIDEKRYRPVGSNGYVAFRAQIVAATHNNLQEMVDDGTFREDLFERLYDCHLTVPPLRDRREDIPLLIEQCLRGMTPPRLPSAIDPDCGALLLKYHFPGNVRELVKVVRRLVLLPDAPLDLRREVPVAGATEGPSPGDDLLGKGLSEARSIAIERFERWYVGRVVAASGGSVDVAARRMGIGRKGLYKRMGKLGLTHSGQGVIARAGGDRDPRH